MACRINMCKLIHVRMTHWVDQDCKQPKNSLDSITCLTVFRLSFHHNITQHAIMSCCIL